MKNVAMNLATHLTSKLTEPLWSVSNALNRKCAYVEASAESAHMKERSKKKKGFKRVLRFFNQLQIISKSIRTCFFLSFLVQKENNLLQAKTLVCHYGQRSAFLLSEAEISKPLNVLPLVLPVPSLHDNENQKTQQNTRSNPDGGEAATKKPSACSEWLDDTNLLVGRTVSRFL